MSLVGGGCGLWPGTGGSQSQEPTDYALRGGWQSRFVVPMYSLLSLPTAVKGRIVHSRVGLDPTSTYVMPYRPSD